MEIEKNTVPAQNQLPEDAYISFEGPDTKELRIAFVGNSITRHGKAPQLGWEGDWGMAASSKERDYVHLVMRKFREKGIAVSACICNGAHWEQTYGEAFDLEYFQQVKRFRPDILIMRLVENCPVEGFCPERFSVAYDRLIQYLIGEEEDTKVILTTGFWKHPGDAAIRRVAEERGYPCICLGELGEMECMKASGRFTHEGVAAHPGDAGMEEIARRIMQCIGRVEIE